MASFTRLWWVALALLLWTPHSQCRNFTHEDIRDAMLSVVHMMRISEDKLERHEYREKALGEHIKKMLSGLDKKHRALEPLKGMISRLDERLSNVETILLQKEEREKSVQKKTNEMLENIQKTLHTISTYVLSSQEISDKPNAEDNLTTSQDSLSKKLEVTDAKIDSVKMEIDKLKNSLSKEAIRTLCLELASNMNPFEKHMRQAEEMMNKYSIAKPLEKHLSEAEKLLNKYELKLNEYNETSFKMPTDIVQLNEVALADEAWHNKMTEVMEHQGADIKKIQTLLSDAEGVWKDLPRKRDLELATNLTLKAVVNASEVAKESDEKSVAKMSGKLRELSERLASTNEDIQRSLTEGNMLAERAFTDIANNYKQLASEVQSLSKSEQVMLQTADNVIATKKRIEYAVQQIVIQITEMLLKQAKSVNGTVTDRLSHIESALLESQALSQVNLSSKIEREMSQVWRQIGIMHEQLQASKGTLDKLNEQTGHYVNTSSTTLGKVQDEVSGISERMVTLGDNFNYALGRLSLVTQQFSHISTGLSDALTNFKKDVHDSNAKEDISPGPHKIEGDE